jgi:4-amino-4-deoxy-L-arabinose transferase-like glycosyltransferase
VVAFSVALCVVVWLTVREITGNLWAAGLAGLAGALSPILVTNGVFITPDTYSAFFAAVALAGALLVYRNGRRFDYLVAALGVGLSAGAKYNAAVVAISPIVAHVARYRRASLRSVDRLDLAGLISLVMFVVTTPTALLHTHEFVTSALKELHHYQTGQSGVTGSSFGFYMSTLSHDSILWLVAALLAVAGLIGRWKNESLIVAVYGITYLVLLSSQVVHFDRDILPLLPALLLLTGFGFATLYETVSADQTQRLSRSHRRTVSLAVLGALVLVLAFPAVSSAKVASKLSDHPRSQARAWLEAHIPAGSEIVIDAYGPWMPPGLFKVVPRTFVVSSGPLPAGAAAVVVAQGGSGRYLAAPGAYPAEVAAYRAFTRQWCLAKQFTDGAWQRIFVPCA